MNVGTYTVFLSVSSSCKVVNNL